MYSRILGIILRSLYEYRHNVDRVTDTIFWPVIDIIIWGFVTLYFGNALGNYNLVNILLGALILWGIMYSVQRDITTSFIVDVWDKNLFNVMATPVNIYEMLIGSTLLGLIKSLATGMLIALGAMLIYGLEIIAFLPIMFFTLIELIFFAVSFGIVATSIIYRFGSKMQTVTWSLLFLIQPIACVFYPLSALPPLLQKFALIFPPVHIFEGMREFLSSGAQPPLETWIIASALNIGYLLLAMFLFLKAFRHARKRGWFVTME